MSVDVDDTCVTQDQLHKDEFLNHINSVDNAIHFTVDEAKEDVSIPFLDTEHVKGPLRLLILVAPCWMEVPWLPTVLNMLDDIP